MHFPVILCWIVFTFRIVLFMVNLQKSYLNFRRHNLLCLSKNLQLSPPDKIECLQPPIKHLRIRLEINLTLSMNQQNMTLSAFETKARNKVDFINRIMTHMQSFLGLCPSKLLKVNKSTGKNEHKYGSLDKFREKVWPINKLRSFPPAQ